MIFFLNVISHFFELHATRNVDQRRVIFFETNLPTLKLKWNFIFFPWRILFLGGNHVMSCNTIHVTTDHAVTSLIFSNWTQDSLLALSISKIDTNRLKNILCKFWVCNVKKYIFGQNQDRNRNSAFTCTISWGTRLKLTKIEFHCNTYFELSFFLFLIHFRNQNFKLTSPGISDSIFGI